MKIYVTSVNVRYLKLHFMHETSFEMYLCRYVTHTLLHNYSAYLLIRVQYTRSLVRALFGIRKHENKPKMSKIYMHIITITMAMQIPFSFWVKNAETNVWWWQSSFLFVQNSKNSSKYHRRGNLQGPRRLADVQECHVTKLNTQTSTVSMSSETNVQRLFVNLRISEEHAH